MSWKAEIKDEHGVITAGLRVAGFDIDNRTTEVLLNVIDYMREKPNCDLRDVLTMAKLSRELFEDNSEKP